MNPPPDPPSTVPRAPQDLTAAYAPDTARLFGRYELVRELGRGGMGVVYAARDPELRRDVAVKVLAPELAADPRAVERFLREARSQARVAHEHVVPVYDVGQDAAGGPYLVMPLLEGAPLSAIGALPVPELVRVGREIAEGLAAAHAAGLIHRDIKPANVWLEAPRRNVKILDFGLARGGESGDPARTAPGSFAGTPAYMSPEQARGQRVDFRTDLFSLGAVLYQLATGTKPFPQTVLLDLLNAVVNHDPPPLLDRVPDCPPVLSALVARLMAKDPEARPASAQQVAEELRASGARRQTAVGESRNRRRGARVGRAERRGARRVRGRDPKREVRGGVFHRRVQRRGLVAPRRRPADASVGHRDRRAGGPDGGVPRHRAGTRGVADSKYVALSGYSSPAEVRVYQLEP